METIEIIERIVSDDFSADMECDLAFDRLTTEKEKIMAKKLGEIYKIAHSANKNHSCYAVHDNWRQQTKELSKLKDI